MDGFSLPSTMNCKHTDQNMAAHGWIKLRLLRLQLIIHGTDVWTFFLRNHTVEVMTFFRAYIGRTNPIPKRFVSLAIGWFIFAGTAVGDTGSVPAANQRDFHYPVKLYLQKDYYRSITETLRLKFKYPGESAKHQLDVFLLKSYYHLKDFTQVEKTANEIFQNPLYLSNRSANRETSVFLTLSLLEVGREKEAEEVWHQFAGESPTGPLPWTSEITGRVDPEKAEFCSGIVPGLGLMLSGEYTKAAVSFLLNFVFIVGSYQYFMQKQFGISGLLLFFEIGWYSGGKKASREAAVEYNRRIARQYRKNWARSVLTEQER